MTTKWEFLDHPDGTESPYEYDDQTPPSYLEKTSAGVWSLTKTGNLANREDLLSGNNWDYISDNGTIVSFYFKNWDNGYSDWSGPYLRATWPSNSSADTITVTNVNNGNFYLKQPSSGMGTLHSVTWTASFVNIGGNQIEATITGTPLSAFGAGFSAVDIYLMKETNNAQTTVSTVVEFPDNTTVNSQYRTFYYTAGSTYFFANANVYGIYGPSFTASGYTPPAPPSIAKNVHSNFW